MIKIAVLGYGTVGSGVVEVVARNAKLLRERAGEEIYIKYILDLRDFPGDPYEDRVIHDFGTILNDPEISILCEVMGGVGAAYQFTKQALEAGKSVCTSNKELVAKHGAEFLAIAKRMRCNYMFEASVAGGIPIIRTINSALAADRVEAVTGILNGTTNFILTKMEKEGADYGEVLRQAQELGYAERNPEADVEGLDAGRKIAILADMLTGKNVAPDRVMTEGITKISTADFAYARAAGMTIKLLARCRVFGASLGKGGRCVQRRTGHLQHAGGCHVRRTGRGQASHCQRGCCGRDGLRHASGQDGDARLVVGGGGCCRYITDRESVLRPGKGFGAEMSGGKLCGMQLPAGTGRRRAGAVRPGHEGKRFLREVRCAWGRGSQQDTPCVSRRRKQE